MTETSHLSENKSATLVALDLLRTLIFSHGSLPVLAGNAVGGLFNKEDTLPCDVCIISLANKSTETQFFLSQDQTLSVRFPGGSSISHSGSLGLGDIQPVRLHQSIIVLNWTRIKTHHL